MGGSCRHGSDSHGRDCVCNSRRSVSYECGVAPDRSAAPGPKPSSLSAVTRDCQLLQRNIRETLSTSFVACNEWRSFSEVRFLVLKKKVQKRNKYV